MTKKFPQGILLIAYNNSQIDYAKLAILAATQAKKYMNGIHVTLMTDEPTLTQLFAKNKKTQIAVFDHIIVEKIEHESNTRVHHDSPWNEFSTQFSNKNKHSIYDTTPYEKTLMIDEVQINRPVVATGGGLPGAAVKFYLNNVKVSIALGGRT